MRHLHTYEPLVHRRISPELLKSGLESAEIRKCTECGKEMPFVLTARGSWVPLFEEMDADEQDILLA